MSALIRLIRPFMVNLMLARRIVTLKLSALIYYQLLLFQLHLVVQMNLFRPAHLPHFRPNVNIRHRCFPTPSIFVRLDVLHPFVVTVGKSHLFLLPLTGSYHIVRTRLVLRFILACLGVPAGFVVIKWGRQVANEHIVKVPISRSIRRVEFACLAC